jgi:hypothetical protein
VPHDGAVDAADYVVWRKSGGQQAGYDPWRANFGATLGDGGGVMIPSSDSAVPEPESLVLLLLTTASLLAIPRGWVAAKNRC